jgi:hypothetical protein
VLSRLTTIASRPKQTLAALAVALLAVGVAVGSSASFTASAPIVTNTFSSGTLSIAASPGSALLTATNLAPGDSVTGDADIENTGSVSGDFSMDTIDVAGSDYLLEGLELRIQDCGLFVGVTPPPCLAGSPEVYSGDVKTASAVLGAWNAGDKHRYRFTVTLPSTADNTYQGLSGSVTFRWNAVSN